MTRSPFNFSGQFDKPKAGASALGASANARIPSRNRHGESSAFKVAFHPPDLPTRSRRSRPARILAFEKPRSIGIAEVACASNALFIVAHLQLARADMVLLAQF
jgi:hypothetical protein